MKDNEPMFPESWQSRIAADCFLQISTTHKKIKTKDCNEIGLYPVIDQGQASVAGYIDDPSKVIEVDSPLCIFGDHTRVVKWVDRNFVPGADGTKVLQSLTFLSPRFAYHQLCNMDIPDKGYSRHFKYFKELWFGIPPLAEQKVIVEKLDTLLAQVETTKARLESTLEILKQFRQSVLAAAVSGKLTGDWRSTNTLTDPLITWGISKEVHFEGELPKEWRSVQLGDVSVRVSVGHVGKTAEFYTDEENGIPFLRSQNVRPGHISLDGLNYITREAHDSLKKSQLQAGDLLVVRVGANRGDSCVLPDMFTAVNCANIVFARPKQGLSPYLDIYFQSPTVQALLLGKSVGGAQGVINTKSVQATLLVLPPIEEQVEIVRRVELLFAGADNIEQQVHQALDRVNHLTQSILSKAFRGELTKQWRKENPELISGENSAEALLKKIKAGRAAAKPKRKTRKKTG